MKKLRIPLLLLLCVLLLCGCVRTPARPAEAAETAALPAESLPPESEEEVSLPEGEAEKRIETLARQEDIPLFGDMVYERPSLEELEALIADAEDAMDAGEDYETVEPLLDDCFLYYYHFDTMYTLADIRSCLDLSDEYYADEYLWCAENYTLIDQAMDGLYYFCAASPLAQELEEKYFWEGFCEQYSDESESIYSDETVALMQQESNLIAEYRTLSADPVISFRGKEENLAALLTRFDGAGDADGYNSACIAYFTQYNERYADLYIRLVSVREKLAEALGYETYEQMQYVYAFERDYSPEQAEAYLQDIKKYMVPLYRDLSVSAVLNEVWYSQLDEDTLRNILRQSVSDFGGSVSEAYDFMLRYELCDLKQDSRKANISFETYLNDYEAPYLFVNSAGTNEDILTFAHEFGHYCDAYVNLNAYETVDLAEVYSQAMEYLVLSRLDEHLDEEEVDNLARIKMIDTVDMFVRQASYAEFEHRVYALGAENLNAEVLNETARQVAKEYGLYNRHYDEFFSLSWGDIPHYFEQAFYIVSYPISDDLAEQIFALECEEAGAGMRRYLDNLERDFSGMMGLVDAGGFESPFAPGRVQTIAATAREILGL